MDIEQGLGLILWLFWLVFVGLRWFSPARGEAGFRPSSSSLGNALQTLQVYVQPRAQHVLQERLEEDTEEDLDGDPDHPVDPVLHLKRQAERIRRGEEVERITTFLR